MVVSGLKLHPPPGRLTAIIALAGRCRYLRRARNEPVLNLAEPAEVIARGREIALAEEFAGRMNFVGVYRRPRVDSRLQVFD